MIDIYETFEEWCEELDRIAKEAGYSTESYTTDCGPENFRFSWEDGDTPEDYWVEEMSAAADCCDICDFEEDSE